LELILILNLIKESVLEDILKHTQVKRSLDVGRDFLYKNIYMTDDLKIEDQYIKGYQTIDGKQVPVIKCPTTITVRNKTTGTVYASEAEALADVANPDTTTKQEDIAKDVAVTVAHLSLFGETR
jgi:hypothetical protein